MQTEFFMVPHGTDTNVLHFIPQIKARSEKTHFFRGLFRVKSGCCPDRFLKAGIVQSVFASFGASAFPGFGKRNTGIDPSGGLKSDEICTSGIGTVKISTFTRPIHTGCSHGRRKNPARKIRRGYCPGKIVDFFRMSTGWLNRVASDWAGVPGRGSGIFLGMVRGGKEWQDKVKGSSL